jgi:hypothetical protein
MPILVWMSLGIKMDTMSSIAHGLICSFFRRKRQELLFFFHIPLAPIVEGLQVTVECRGFLDA